MVKTDSQEPERAEYAFFLQSLGARIRCMRKERGWTYRDMVMRHGFHLSAWQAYETGRVGISLPSLLRVAKAFSMHPSELLAGIDASLSTEEAPTASASKPAARSVRKRVGAPRRPKGTN